MMSDAASPIAPAGIWVQLLVSEEKQGQIFEIKPIPENVDELKTAVIEEWGGHLAVAAPRLHVFAPGTDPATEDALDSGDPVPDYTSSTNPLIVIAPKPHQQQQVDFGQQVKLLEAQRDAEKAKRQKLETDVIFYQMVALQTRTTTENVLYVTEDTLATAFERAKIVPMWLPPLSKHNQNIWRGPWEAYKKTDEANQEVSAIQPAIHQSFAPNFPHRALLN